MVPALQWRLWHLVRGLYSSRVAVAADACVRSARRDWRLVPGQKRERRSRLGRFATGDTRRGCVGVRQSCFPGPVSSRMDHARLGDRRFPINFTFPLDPKPTLARWRVNHSRGSIRALGAKSGGVELSPANSTFRSGIGIYTPTASPRFAFSSARNGLVRPKKNLMKSSPRRCSIRWRELFCFC